MTLGGIPGVFFVLGRHGRGGKHGQSGDMDECGQVGDCGRECKRLVVDNR